MKQNKTAEITVKNIKVKNNSQLSVTEIIATYLLSFVIAIFFLILFSASASAQTDGSREKYLQRNKSGTMSLDIPLGNYKGRGMDLPVSLSYSSTVWNIKHKGAVYSTSVPFHVGASVKQSITEAIYAENSVAGWKSTLDLPTIEFPDEKFDKNGQPGARNNCSLKIQRLYVHMPDGSTHELRINDTPITGGIDTNGNFYAVDGSRLRYVGTGPGSGTLYLPDGTRYLLHYLNSSSQWESSIIDRNGNTMIYNEAGQYWTDTLGRVINKPLSPQADTDQPYTVYGINGNSIIYTLKWKYLSEVLSPVNGTTPALKVAASYYLPDPNAPLTNSNAQNANFPLSQSQYPSLFQEGNAPVESGAPDQNPIPILIVGRGQIGGNGFNPVVLSEIVLPNGTSYKFSYTVYGEIDKVTYPTGAYEKYEYSGVAAGEGYSEPYIQAGRRLASRKVSINGTGSDLLTWSYINQTRFENGAGLLQIIAPDNTRTDIHKSGYIYDTDSSDPFGVAPATDGAVTEEDFYANSAANGTGGQLLRRELTQYDQTITSTAVDGCGSTVYFPSYRNARPTRKTGIIFEGSVNPALAQTQTYTYNADHQLDTGVEQIQSDIYDYAIVSNATTAQSGSIDQIPAGNRLKYTVSTYLDDQTYRDRNILGMQRSFTVKSNDGTVLSQGEIIRDEINSYPLINAGTANHWQDPYNDYRANITTLRTWIKETNSWIETHVQFDNFGNIRKQWDSSGDPNRFIETQYSSQYNYAYPTKIISQAPDPTGIHGTTETSELTKTYDFTTGLVTSQTDVNGQTVTTEYDSQLRPKKITPPVGGAVEETEYGIPDSNGQFSDEQRFIKNKEQIDQTNWAEQTIWFDRIGRVVKTQSKDSQGDIFTETKYDELGRVKQVSSPYRQGDQILWSKPRYDDRNRIVEIYALAPDGQTGASTGTIEFGISTVSGFVGTYIVGTDASGRKARSIANVSGQIIRVDEATGNNDLGTLASPNQPTIYIYNVKNELIKVQQGQQNRYFMYDSLGRLIRIRQPEQIVNSNLNTTGNPENNQWTMGYAYDVFGNVTGVTDANGIVITNSYDNLGRIKTRSYSDGITPQVDYYYDGKGLPQTPQYAKGNLTKVSSSVSENRYTSFDNFGRMLASQQITDGQTYNFGYSYNLSGNLIEETYPSLRVVKNYLNTDGGLATISSKTATGQYKTYATNFNYTATGDIKAMMLGNGRWETAQFNSRLQLTQIGLGNSATDTSLWKANYEYGELSADGVTVDTTKNTGSIAKQTVTLPTTSFVQTYKYDELNRLTEARETTGTTENWKQIFGYDKFGNRTNFTQTIGSTQLATNSVNKPTVDINTNRFTTGQGYIYDLNGNLTQDAENRGFTYNGDDRQTVVRDLTIATSPSNPDANVIGRYFYDGDGRRVKKVTNTETTVFVYDGKGDLAAEYSTATPPATPTTSYLTTDQLGSPRVITDKMGEVIARRDFMPFGEELGIGVGARSASLKYSFTSTDNTRQRFTGYQKDSETLLDFAEARMYQNRHGRFTAADPLLDSASLSNPQTFNRYTYTGNNPINYTDPDGLKYYENTTDGSIVWFDKPPADTNLWKDLTGQVLRITSVGTNSSAASQDIRATGAQLGDFISFGDNRGSVRVVTPENMTPEESTQIAILSGANVVDTERNIVETNITNTVGEFLAGTTQGAIGSLNPMCMTCDPRVTDTGAQRAGQFFGTFISGGASGLLTIVGGAGDVFGLVTGQVEVEPITLVVTGIGIYGVVTSTVYATKLVSTPLQMSGMDENTTKGGRTNKTAPVKDADGPHTTIKKDPQGNTTGTETWKSNPKNPRGWDSKKRVDLNPKGSPHKGVPTPHTQGNNIKGGVRPSRKWEIPK